MEWAIVVVIVAVACRYGISGLTGGLVITAAVVALVVGINIGSTFLASIGGLFLLAALAGGFAEVRKYLSDDVSGQAHSRRY